MIISNIQNLTHASNVGVFGISSTGLKEFDMDITGSYYFILEGRYCSGALTVDKIWLEK